MEEEKQSSGLARAQALAEAAGLTLTMEEAGLTLRGNGLELRGDLTQSLPRLKKNNLQQEMLVKAAKIRGTTQGLLAVDATAGLGEDAILLAAAGFTVRLYEYNPVIAALLRDALDRASQTPELADIVARMELFEEDSLQALPALPVVPDVVVLDPMFPSRQKSALIKKKFQLLQKLEIPCATEEALVEAAMAAKPFKIIIKRPVKGPYLAGLKPAYSMSGKAIRYDCLVFPQNEKK